ncbi:ATP-binding protein [Kibdelosporangium aridum]|uniref:AAA ATPase domain-containing protein n=1 Tax=Kibdelosporangium aridum TaxID=2030 RepID=A0A1W2FAG8_KIBAR|nr:ATP-binding protein [Kibdelosporangium aridum]SMD18930.1 hypothetical protein SAMN05661093_05969 [Kibdelosporangium aridum]
MSPGERFRVFEAVTEYLTGVGKVLIVLDHLQWADPPTVQLLVHLARAIGSAPVMILVTYRDTEVSPALSDGLASLAREETVSRIRLGTCAAVLDRPLDGVLASMDEALQAGVLSGLDGWWFTHDLVREAARLLMPTARRLALHARTATAMEQRPEAAQRVAEIAHHWLEALPAGDATKAAEWARRAGDAAMAQLAWENAVRLYARALLAAPDMPDVDRASVLISKGIAQLRQMDIHEPIGGMRRLSVLCALVVLAEQFKDRRPPRWHIAGCCRSKILSSAVVPESSPSKARSLAR